MSMVKYYNLSESFSTDNEYETKSDLRIESISSKTKTDQKEGPVVIKSRTKEKYPCEFCNESFKRKDRLDRHLFSHTKKKPYCCDVEGCSKEYTNQSHLNRHKKANHKKKPEFQEISCKDVDCLLVFTNLSNMNRHYQTHHVNPLRYSCSSCGDKFRRKLQMKKHEIQKHSGQYPYTCLHCNKGFINTFAFSRHLTTHKDKTFTRSCPDCNAAFSKWSQFVEHRRKEHKSEPKYLCDLCDKSFYRKPNIKEHIKLHMSEIEVFQCSYDNCSKFYNARRNLQSHIRSKHEGKRWTCDLCRTTMSSKQRLEQHVLAHLDPVLSKRLVKKTSLLSKLAGVKLPVLIEERILSGESSQIDIDTMLQPESTQETSGAEMSDF